MRRRQTSGCGVDLGQAPGELAFESRHSGADAALGALGERAVGQTRRLGDPLNLEARLFDRRTRVTLGGQNAPDGLFGRSVESLLVGDGAHCLPALRTLATDNAIACDRTTPRWRGKSATTGAARVHSILRWGKTGRIDSPQVGPQCAGMPAGLDRP